jgi:glycine/D-amino acid oxidase-like deaminating enzyme
MLGVTLGPATGRVVADLVTTGSTAIDLTPFAPSRF